MNFARHKPLTLWTTLIVVAVVAVAPTLAWASPCACRSAAMSSVAVEQEAAALPSAPVSHSCCHKLEATAPTAEVHVPQTTTDRELCTVTGRSHVGGSCCCVDKAPQPATTVAVANFDAAPRLLEFALPAVAVSSASQVEALLSTLRLGSPAELAYASQPSFSILYGVWRN
ncbi:MAG: hypothetical protein JNK76_14705 [Planctomycetales bacterium]|nr:hypothetical protein [Planctomycetales bacterium]MBN8624183.1 hypothetical protein [Planctomycetota bacterium]